MKKATDHTIAALKERQYRITKARQCVVHALADQTAPQTIQEIVEDVSIDEASVYRILTVLQKERLVEEITIPGYKPKFSLAHGHHHHVVCEDCGVIAHVPCERTPVLKQMPSDFHAINSHDLTFYGRCKKCA